MRSIVIIIFLSFIWSCTSEDDPEAPVITNTSLFPLTMGSSTTYQVTEIIYRQEGRIKDTLSYQLLEEVSDSFTDESNATIFLLDRYQRNDASEEWSFKENWVAKICDNELIVTEENIPFVKLVLPIKKDEKWIATKYFETNKVLAIGGEDIDYFKNWESKIIDTNTKWQDYNNVTTVIMADFENRLEKRYAIERYAENIGLVYREILVVDTQCFENCQSRPWLEKAERGHYYIQEILE